MTYRRKDDSASRAPITCAKCREVLTPTRKSLGRHLGKGKCTDKDLVQLRRTLEAQYKAQQRRRRRPGHIGSANEGPSESPKQVFEVPNSGETSFDSPTDDLRACLENFEEFRNDKFLFVLSPLKA